MKHLIILNHQPDIPPFMVSDMKYAVNYFEHVWYVNTRCPINLSLFQDNDKYSFLFPTLIERELAKMKAVFYFITPQSLRQMFQFIKDKGIKMHYLKQLAKFYASDACIRPLAQKVILKLGAENSVVLSTWFGGCALSAAWLKKKNANIKAYSLAHSYEILVSRDPYIPYHFVNFKHEYLDGVFFIAETMRQLYFKGVGALKKEYIDNTYVSYLGSIKDDIILNKTNKDCFNICSCSRMIPLKRLDILCEALLEWNVCKIKWTHLGGGETEAEIRKRADTITKSNPLVTIEISGRKTNKEIKDYYKNNPVDLFCNLSSIEGVPISIMEAISYGIPVIATDVGGTKEIVTKEVGVLLESDINPEIVRNALERFYFQPDHSKESLRCSAHFFWDTHFNADKNIPQFLQIISS